MGWFSEGLGTWFCVCAVELKAVQGISDTAVMVVTPGTGGGSVKVTNT